MPAGDWSDTRPLSPHLQVWRFHLTMVASISHRMSGCALYFGSALIAAWIFSLTLSPTDTGGAPAFYLLMEAVLGSFLGQIILILWAAAVLYHFANGLRHLLWDGPAIGFDPKIASAWSAFNFAFAGFGAVALWAAATFI
ncbi:MAG: succinate dehydrogenase, cytochrome b556 subunit [Pseudomonadota bacterium]